MSADADTAAGNVVSLPGEGQGTLTTPDGEELPVRTFKRGRDVVLVVLVDTETHAEEDRVPSFPVKVEHGRHLHLTVRPTAPVQLLFTGHMDTVFELTSPFQKYTVNGDIATGPGVNDLTDSAGRRTVQVKALHLCKQNPTVIHGKEKVYGSIP